MRLWVDATPKDGRIRTACRCGRFIGYRPEDLRRAKHQQEAETVDQSGETDQGVIDFDCWAM